MKNEPNPAVVYRQSLSRGSYWGVHHALTTIAEMLTGEETDPWTYPWWKLRYRDTAAVRATLKERFAPATVNRMLSALRGVLKNAWRLGQLDADTYRRAVDIANVRAKTLPRGRSLEQEELRKLFAVCAEDPSPAGERDAALLAVLYGCGLRRAEACGLDVADYDREERILTVRRGKGRRERVVYLTDSVRRHLDAWLEARSCEPGPIFCPVSSAGRVRVSRMRGETIGYILRRRQEAAGLKGFSAHDLRRGFITGLLEAGVDIFTVQKLAGHADAVTTARYDRRGEGVRRSAAQALRFPAPI
jgi:integrase